MRGAEIIARSGPFFDWLAAWYDDLPTVSLQEAIPEPDGGALLVADLVLGFCRLGPLASPRIDAIVPATVALFRAAHALGTTRFLLAQDTHPPDAPEFGAWPPHCVAGTQEAAAVPELQRLPFADRYTVIEKNALSVGIGTEFERWLVVNDDVTHYLVTGDCTDLCTYQLAMYVRMWANATNRAGKHVIVDASAVQTYDLPVEAAVAPALPHPGDFLHMLFLYHMALNGIRVVARVDLPDVGSQR